MRTILFILTLTLSGGLFAQRGGPPETPKGEIYGSIIDSLTTEPLSYVAVVAFNQETGTLEKGVVTDDNGKFSLAELPYGTYKLKISFVGYNTIFLEDQTLSEENVAIELKDFELGPTILNTVEVVGGTPEITYEIDKKVINVEDQYNAEGLTAVEVLENIPSITVSPDGTVSLRGSSSFMLLIDGIPTAMEPNDALAVIPANSIKDIEIITNPSAKFDAEGTSGVINIITKKSKLEGVSCLVNLSAGTFGNYSGNTSVNIKKEKFSINISANGSQRSRPRQTYIERETVYDSLTNLLVSDGESNWKMQSWGGGIDFQYNPNSAHVFIAKTNANFRYMIPYSDYEYMSYDDGVLVDQFTNDQHNNISILGSTSSLFYQYNIRRNKEHNISFKAIANLRSVTQYDTTISRDEAGLIRDANLYTETGPSNSFRFNIDYVLPLKNDRKFMTGLQSQLGQSGDVGRNYVYNTVTGEFDLNELFSSDVDYVRDVHAGYLMYNGKRKKLGYQFGLRAEYTYRTISSTNFVDFTTINRLDWFPSAHFSYSMENKSQFLLSYSRRIERPRSYFFEPFVTWESPFNVRSGNPNLIPEYINALEFSYVNPIKQKGYFSVDVYYRQNQNVIQRISTVYDDGILISQPYNIGQSISAGIEPAFIYEITKWWKLNTSFNGYLFRLTGEINDVSYDTESFNYGARVTNDFKFKGDWTLQLVSSYRSGSVTPQGSDVGVYRQDVSLRKSFAKNRFSLGLQGRNIFNTAVNQSVAFTENVTITTIREPLWPQVTLNLSIRLNNYQKVYERNEEMDDF